jgi:putative SOS response-associated peptidase YedK
VCGRYVAPDEAAIERAWRIGRNQANKGVFAARRYNVTPGSAIAVLRRDGDGFELCEMRWGLVPSWAGAAESGLKTINARSETVATSAAYRAAFRSRRCLVPALGWYEWKILPGRRKCPYYLSAGDGRLLAFAAIWERRQESATQALESVSILTRPANGDVAAVHDRMPVVFDAAGQQEWVDAPAERAEQLVQMAMAGEMVRVRAHPVSARINRAQFDDAALIEPVDVPAAAQRDLWDT